MKQIKFKGRWWGVRRKKLFPEKTLAKIFQASCSFSLKQHPTGKVLFLFLKNFFLALPKY